MTSLSILLLLLLRDFVPKYHHAKFGGNWTTNKGETLEGGSTKFSIKALAHF